ncbi:MAG: DNA internalization-related competence protein ComEC/Rec2 [Clostridia bacterium]|nr:DNA internalization-related competence protein ComEC/Rec2 [Clostridia bacterium]
MQNKYDKAFLINENEYFGQIVSLKEEVKYYNRYVLKIKSGKYKNYRVLIYSKNNLEYGDIIKFSGDIEKPDTSRNDNGFNYSRYLREKKISGIIKLDKFEIISKQNDFKYYLFKLKLKLINILDKNYLENEAGFLKIILLGSINTLDENIKEDFKSASISHILAISGLHISYIVLGIETILKLFIKNIKIRDSLIIIFLIIFSIFVGESNSVIRACIMTFIIYFGKIVLKKDNFFTSFKVALSILLIYNPYNIFSVSMWLSFGGSIGIVLYSRLIEKYGFKVIIKKLKEKNIKNEYIKKLVKKIIQIISVTVGAQIIVFPIIIYTFNTFSLNFIISNLLISELIGPLIIFGYLSLIIPFLSIIEKKIIKIVLFLSKNLANLPLNNIIFITPSLFKILLYYIILVILALFWDFKKIYLIRKMKRYKFKSFIIITVVLVVLFGNFRLPFRKNIEINFLDVGQGDSSLIRTIKNRTILLDSGNGEESGYDYGEKVVIPYLLDHGISKIDYILISHFDSDHAGGFVKVLESLDIKNIILAEQIEKNDIYVKIISTARKKDINLIFVKAGNVLNIDNIKLTILHPQDELIIDNAMNNNSIVCKLEYKDFSILFTGDIENIAEEKILNIYKNTNILDVDVLKVAHHRF